MENYLAGPNLIGAQAKVQAMPHSRNDLTGIEALSLNYMSPGRFIYIQHDGNLF